MFTKMSKSIDGRDALVVEGLGKYKIDDTLECGQIFRYEPISKTDGYCEYLIPVGDDIVRVGQYKPGELIFYGADDELFEKKLIAFFSLDTDYQAISRAIADATDSEWMRSAVECAGGIAILAQDGWETLFSFIVSQNNNIPRIRKILFSICRAYGKNLAVSYSRCPLGKHGERPCDKTCGECGICYSFPSPAEVLAAPEKLLPSKPGFRYKYLLCCAEAITEGSVSLAEIAEHASYEYTLEQLKKIKGVGDKVASCVALFGFRNLEAFPIDVWVKKAINDYFSGHLDYKSFGNYAGVAQQYIFHYIRNIESKGDKNQ